MSFLAEVAFPGCATVELQEQNYAHVYWRFPCGLIVSDDVGFRDYLGARAGHQLHHSKKHPSLPWTLLRDVKRTETGYNIRYFCDCNAERRSEGEAVQHVPRNGRDMSHTKEAQS